MNCSIPGFPIHHQLPDRAQLSKMSIESVMPSNHRILCHPLFLLPSTFPSIRVFSSGLFHQVAKYWSFSFSISPSVTATRSRKPTHSEGQCKWWSAVYYTGGPKAESPLSKGPWPAFVKIFYTTGVYVQTHHPNFLETYINKGGVNTTKITPSFMCYVFKQLIINKPAVTFQPVNNR